VPWQLPILMPSLTSLTLVRGTWDAKHIESFKQFRSLTYLYIASNTFIGSDNIQQALKSGVPVENAPSL
jgi:hypothetical protein